VYDAWAGAICRQSVINMVAKPFRSPPTLIAAKTHINTRVTSQRPNCFIQILGLACGLHQRDPSGPRYGISQPPKCPRPGSDMNAKVVATEKQRGVGEWLRTAHAQTSASSSDHVTQKSIRTELYGFTMESQLRASVIKQHSSATNTTRPGGLRSFLPNRENDIRW
jgi:hypothetical protein